MGKSELRALRANSEELNPTYGAWAANGPPKTRQSRGFGELIVAFGEG
jgi:hypothetical protein